MDLEQIEEEEAFSVEEDFEKISEEMQAIVFEEVGFSYENRSVLEHFSVRLEKGSLMAVAGPSGAGKSTMMKLLLGFLLPIRIIIRMCSRNFIGRCRHFGSIAVVR